MYRDKFRARFRGLPPQHSWGPRSSGVTQCTFVVGYKHFGTTYWSHLEGSSSSLLYLRNSKSSHHPLHHNASTCFQHDSLTHETWRWDQQFVPKCQTPPTNLCHVVGTQKSNDLSLFYIPYKNSLYFCLSFKPNNIKCRPLIPNFMYMC